MRRGAGVSGSLWVAGSSRSAIPMGTFSPSPNRSTADPALATEEGQLGRAPGDAGLVLHHARAGCYPEMFAVRRWAGTRRRAGQPAGPVLLNLPPAAPPTRLCPRTPPTSPRPTSLPATATPPTPTAERGGDLMAVGQVVFVQFPHPGGEHHPPGAAMPWNVGTHRRKFLLAPGRYLGPDDDVVQAAELVLWAEWEPPSQIIARWPVRGQLPRALHRPYWTYPVGAGLRQNTDPWVWGQRMLYSNCK